MIRNFTIVFFMSKKRETDRFDQGDRFHENAEPLETYSN